MIGWNSGFNALDNGTNNVWDDTVSIGNAWGDYTGSIPTYAIPGYAGSVDNYPRKADTENPILDHPSDIGYDLDETGYMITWNPVDAHPHSYEIYQNNSLIDDDVWDGSSISISIDGLAQGKYNYTLLVNDTCANEETDMVTIIVGHLVHDPIVITSDVDFAIQAVQNWWGGNGSLEDPFIIMRLNISYDGDCISITDTSVHYMIQNCILTSQDGASGYGIYLSNAPYGRIENCEISSKTTGLMVSDSPNSFLYNNTIHNCNSIGIEITSDSNNCTLSNNTVTENNEGIEIGNSENCTIIHNTIYNHTLNGLYFIISYNCSILNNTIYDCNSGISLEVSNNFTIESNYIYNCNEIGIDVFSSTNTVINLNRIYNILVLGIRLSQGSHNSFIYRNNVSFNDMGVIIESTDYCTIRNNSILHQLSSGVYLQQTINCTIANNNICYSGYDGIHIENSLNSTIYGNQIWYNLRGIDIDESENCALTQNALINNGLEISGSQLKYWNFSVKDNTVNGKPLGYFWTIENIVVKSSNEEYGQIILVNCESP